MCPYLSLSIHVSRLSTDEEGVEGMSKNNTILNFGFLFGINNGLIDEKLNVPR
jgi:hypothetical protein